MSELCQRAQILIEALPYIRQYHGQTVVVKYGGAAMVHDDLKRAVMQDIALLYYVGLQPIVVHGGGKEISDAMQAMGKEPAFVNGLRVTDAETMRITEMVLVGRICGEIVQQINQAGGRAVGLSGKDGGLLRARKRCDDPASDLGYVGCVEQVQAGVLETLTRDGFIPVISPVAFGADGNTYNLNADHAASSVAVAMKAAKLILLTDVRGVYGDLEDESSYLPELTRQQVREMMECGAIGRGMIPKLNACLEALDGGVARTHIVDGRLAHALLMEIFTDSGIGTMVLP